MATSRVFVKLGKSLIAATKTSSASFASSAPNVGGGLKRAYPISPQLGKFLGNSSAPPVLLAPLPSRRFGTTSNSTISR
ncbi:upstream activation factor subunit spp27 [Corchorus capsularis]|uniref:Upstream activation factor subunit spp27 n=1 Tax=Corchorus capsularis TaxID=210143 RepID=A0A1R3J0L7_COCAP|nr:upstream activation factor subunit spp27 [Corchorus capsularis]